MNASPLRRVRANNYTAASYRSYGDVLASPQVPFPLGDLSTVASPNLSSILQLSSQGASGHVQTFMELWPYGVGADTNTFNMRVLAWQRLIDPVLDANQYQQWCPSEIGEFTCTLSTDSGVAGGVLGTTSLYCDTIAVVTEESFTAATTRTGTVWVISPANNNRGHIRIDIEGVEAIEILFSSGTGTPACNALYRFYDRYID